MELDISGKIWVINKQIFILPFSDILLTEVWSMFLSESYWLKHGQKQYWHNIKVNIIWKHAIMFYLFFFSITANIELEMCAHNSERGKMFCQDCDLIWRYYDQGFWKLILQVSENWSFVSFHLISWEVLSLQFRVS